MICPPSLPIKLIVSGRLCHEARLLSVRSARTADLCSPALVWCFRQLESPEIDYALKRCYRPLLASIFLSGLYFNVRQGSVGTFLD